MSTIAKFYIGLAVVAAIALYWITRAGNAAKVGIAVAQGASDLTAGVVEGAAATVGVPMTDAEKCADAIARRDSFDVSLYCPIATFLKYEKDLMFGSDVSQLAPPANNALQIQASIAPSPDTVQ